MFRVLSGLSDGLVVDVPLFVIELSAIPKHASSSLLRCSTLSAQKNQLSLFEFVYRNKTERFRKKHTKPEVHISKRKVSYVG